MVKRVNNKNKISKKSLVAIFMFLLILLVLASFYLLKEGGIIKNSTELSEKNFTIQDKCSIIVGKIVHPIDREDECMNNCVAQCEIYSLSYDRVEFELMQDTCNKCSCFCT